MNLVYIENKQLLTKIITYLDYGKIEYTTDINNKFDTIIIAQNNKKTQELMKLAKKVIYLAYLDEFRIHDNYLKKGKRYLEYKSKLRNFLNKCNIVVVSIPYFKKIIDVKKIAIIPLENLCIGLCKNKFFNLRKKIITIIDSNYRYLDKCFELINSFPNCQYELIGYNANLNKKQRLLIDDMPKSMKLIKYCNNRILENYIKNSTLIIFFDNILESNDYLNICLNLKKNILLLNNELCHDYLIDNKNIYLFSLDSLLKKFNKIMNNRVCNLGLDGYNLIKNNNFEYIADKFCKLLK